MGKHIELFLKYIQKESGDPNPKTSR